VNPPEGHNYMSDDVFNKEEIGEPPEFADWVLDGIGGGFVVMSDD
jgi:hypothetical protein